MSKLLDNINKQEDGEDKVVVLNIYNALKSIDGRVWDSQWNVLVKTIFLGKYPNTKRYFKPSDVYNAIK